MKGSVRLLLRIFLTGLVAALPLVATVAVFIWAGSLLLDWIGPGSAVGSLLVMLGLGVTGSEILSYLIGMAVVVALIFVLGVLVEARLQRGLAHAFNALLRRIPLVAGVYDLIRRMVSLFNQRDEAGMKAMQPVWCHFGGPGGAATLALLSSNQVMLLDGRRCLAVLVPSAPVPVGGVLLWLPEEWVMPAADIGMEALTSIYVSMGVTAPQYLPKGEAERDQQAAR